MFGCKNIIIFKIKFSVSIELFGKNFLKFKTPDMEIQNSI